MSHALFVEFSHVVNYTRQELIIVVLQVLFK